jgi:hypothetical protein
MITTEQKIDQTLNVSLQPRLPRPASPVASTVLPAFPSSRNTLVISLCDMTILEKDSRSKADAAHKKLKIRPRTKLMPSLASHRPFEVHQEVIELGELGVVLGEAAVLARQDML